MDFNELAKKAMDLKNNKHYNCCQAVVCALADETDIDYDILKRISSGFAAGLGNMEGTCGALIGACMIASLKKGDESIRYTREISERFNQKCGSITCKVLKGKVNKNIFLYCEDCVKNAVLAYGEVMYGK